MKWITTDDVHAETWRRLLDYTNADLALASLKRLHPEATESAQDRALQKQVKQIRVAILQAREYFEAASSTSLFTSANHLYYGITSLSSAVMLALGDGTKSLDYLRKDPKNSHHGLKFTTGCSASSASQGLTLLQESRVEILGTGNFCNWYSTLPQRDLSFVYLTNEHRSGGSTTSRRWFGHSELPAFPDIVGHKKSAFDLIRFLPDLHHDLDRFGIDIVHSRTTHEVVQKQGSPDIHTWKIHGVRPRAKIATFLDCFKFCPRLAEKVTYNFGDDATTGVVRLEFPIILDMGMEWPDCRETMNHDSISYGEQAPYNELTEMFLLSYQLSMLSRYFPDLWIACLESQCRAAKLIESCVSIMRRKYPMLCLSMLTDDGMVISTHREPWKGR